MHPIRLAMRACTDNDKIQRFLQETQFGHLGLCDEQQPYVVPLNYVWLASSLYFHGAAVGRKADMIAKNPNATFTVCEGLGTLTHPTPAHTDTAYMSVMIFGKVSYVNDLEEATGAMQAMLDKYVPGYYDQPLSRTHLAKYVSSMGSKTQVFRLSAESITAKENEKAEHRLFYLGKTSHDDK